MRALFGIVLVSSWLAASAALAQTGPSSAPITPPGYGTSVSGASSGVPVVSLTAPAAGPRVEIRERETSLRSVWIPGLIGLPLAWLLTWTYASTTETMAGDAIEYSYIPIVGPWLMLTQPLQDSSYYIASGVFQAASAIALVCGLSIRRTVREQVWVGASLEDVAIDFEITPAPGGGAAMATARF